MTAQVYEKLVIDGEESLMASCPHLPQAHPRIYQSTPREFSRDSRRSKRIISSTACWRGYIGTWEIKDGCFYLVDLRGRYRLSKGGPVFAEWFSGVLRVMQGEKLSHIHMGFAAIYEQEMHIKIKQGLVIERRVIDNRGKQFDEWGLGWKNLPGGENKIPGDDEL